MTSTTALAGFSELYERHYEAVYRAALRVTGNPADAEDVLQIVFLRVLAREDRRRGGPAKRADEPPVAGRVTQRRDNPGDRGGDVAEVALPAAYFKRAAVNAAVDVLRRRELHAESVYDDAAPHAAVQPRLLLKERLRRAIGALNNEDASLFLLRHVEGLSIEELAGMFQMEKK